MSLKKFFPLFSLFICLLLISACGPAYKVDYLYKAPPTSEGKIYARQCVDEPPVCKHACEVKRGVCLKEQEEKAEKKYFEYLKEQKYKETIPDKDQDDFLETYMCSFRNCEDGCDHQQRICHVNCGGDITTHRYCVSNCEKANN